MKSVMRIFIVAAGIGLGTFGSVVAQTPAPTTLHVSRSSMDYPLSYVLRVWGTLGNEKVELVARFPSGALYKEPGILAPGDYPVRLESEKTTDSGVLRKYEVEVRPGKHITFTLAGLAE